MRIADVILVCWISALLGGCAVPRIQPLDTETFLSTAVPFIRDGVTTRRQVLLELGMPSAQFEQQRILTYLLQFEESELTVLMPVRGTEVHGYMRWPSQTYNLVLVFGYGGVLERHSVVVAR